jgi:hypothetical protein
VEGFGFSMKEPGIHTRDLGLLAILGLRYRVFIFHFSLYIYVLFTGKTH